MRMRMAFGFLIGGAIVQLIVNACGRQGTATATEPTVATETCTKSYVDTSNGVTFYYAEHDYPGRTKFELLANVTAGGALAPNGQPASYGNAPTISVSDGKVFVICGKGFNVDFISRN